MRKEIDLNDKLTHTFNEQDKSRVELKKKIDISKGILNMLRRKTNAAMFVEPSAGSAPGGRDGKKANQTPFDLTTLLNKLREKIKNIHAEKIGQGEVAGKTTLALLNVSSSLIWEPS